MSRQATLAAHWVHEPQPISNLVVPRRLKLYRHGRVFDPGMKRYSSRARRDLRVVPTGTHWLHELQPIGNLLVPGRLEL